MWVEVIDMAKSTTAMSTVATFQHLFAAYGLLEQVLSGNVPQFTTEEFTKFLQANGQSKPMFTIQSLIQSLIHWGC